MARNAKCTERLSFTHLCASLTTDAHGSTNQWSMEWKNRTGRKGEDGEERVRGRGGYGPHTGKFLWVQHAAGGVGGGGGRRAKNKVHLILNFLVETQFEILQIFHSTYL